MARPVYVESQHLEYLDGLRESGTTNMFGATPFLMRRFPELSESIAKKILEYWMESFEEDDR